MRGELGYGLKYHPKVHILNGIFGSIWPDSCQIYFVNGEISSVRYFASAAGAWRSFVVHSEELFHTCSFTKRQPALILCK